MRIEFEFLSGARAGRKDAFEKSYIALGRDPLADVRFDAEADLDASTRHAAVVLSGDGYAVRDLGSRNGTFVNGHRIEGDTALSDGDVIRCGGRGPEVRVRLVREAAEQVMDKVAAPAQAPKPATAAKAAAPAPATPPKPAGPSATSILRAEVKASASRFRSLLIVLGIVLVGAVAVLVWQGRTAQKQQAQTLSVLDSLGKELTTLKSAKVAADSEAARLQREIRGASHDPSRLASLQAQYSTVQRRQHDIATAQGVDYRAIVTANSPAIAMVYVQFPDSSMWTGTGFCVKSNGTMLTNRHVVVNEQGQRPIRIAIQFSGSRDILPGRLVRVAPDADIAVLRLESQGPFPVVAGIAADGQTQAGDPIALVGFPLGTDLPQGGTAEQPIVRASLMTGTISRVLGDSLLQLDAFSGTGASGSPILDRAGRVIGIEFGGQRESGGRIVFGLPIKRAQALIAQD
ncbi:MAG: trypsin-like peptidase domain-containing protein [Gemmatimonadales bacterium]|jgi:S1-C subfamily serine protease